jgi:hypothetical protein
MRRRKADRPMITGLDRNSVRVFRMRPEVAGRSVRRFASSQVGLFIEYRQASVFLPLSPISVQAIVGGGLILPIFSLGLWVRSIRLSGR